MFVVQHQMIQIQIQIISKIKYEENIPFENTLCDINNCTHSYLLLLSTL